MQVKLLAHIAEVDRRKLLLVEGHPSLFRYLFDELRMSEYAAYKHIHAVRAVREFPVILERLRDGEIHLAGMRLLAPRLTEENCLELLGRARHKTKRQIEELVADLAPRPDAPETVRRLPERSGPARTAAPSPQPLSPAPAEPGGVEASTETPGVSAAAPQPSAEAPPSPFAPRHPEPLGRGRFKIQFTSDQEFVEMLEEVRSLLRHQLPNGALCQVFARALRVLREDLRRKKFAQTDRLHGRSGLGRNGARSRHVPNYIRREVADRDGESCSYVSPSGRRCDSKDFLEYDHADPWAKHRVHSPKRIRLLCREHNRLAAEREFRPGPHGTVQSEGRGQPEAGRPNWPRGQLLGSRATW